tara:strand:- start:5714 stop:5905 length:192 start_codon:yes stop_codon:yes gene_type:complete
MNPFSRIIAFLREARFEAKKVDWPTREKTIKNTLVVVVFSVAVAIFLSTFDLVFTALLERFVL